MASARRRGLSKPGLALLTLLHVACGDSDGDKGDPKGEDASRADVALVLDARVDGGAGLDADPVLDAEVPDVDVGLDVEVPDVDVGLDAEVPDVAVLADAEPVIADADVVPPDAELDAQVVEDAGVGSPDAAEVFADAEPSLPDAAPIFPDAAPVFADAAPSFPDAAPVFADAAPDFPDAAPVFADAAPIFPDAAPVFADAAPSFPDAAPTIDAGSLDSGLVDSGAVFADAAALDAAALDAAAADAAALDAAALDAMILSDAAAPDAEAPDAMLDAGVLDSGLLDASAPDASAPDASAPDATLDASTPDAAPYDGGTHDGGVRPDVGPTRFYGLTTLTTRPVSASASADFDGNGRPDIVVSTSSLTVAFFNDATGFARVVLDPAPYGELIATDVDLDGDADLVARTPTGVLWLENTGRASVPWPSHQIATQSTTDIDVGDLSGDGLTDVVVLGAGITLYARDATPTWVSQAVHAVTPTNVAVADANVDGVLDITVIRPATCPPNSLFPNTCVAPSTLLTTRTMLGLSFAAAPPMPSYTTNSFYPAQGFFRLESPRRAQLDADPEWELIYGSDTAEWSHAAVVVLDPTPTGWAGSFRGVFGDGSGFHDSVAAGNFDADPEDEIVVESVGLFIGGQNTGIVYGDGPGDLTIFRSAGWPWINAPIVNYHPADIDRDGLLDLYEATTAGVYWQRQAP